MTLTVVLLSILLALTLFFSWRGFRHTKMLEAHLQRFRGIMDVEQEKARIEKDSQALKAAAEGEISHQKREFERAQEQTAKNWLEEQTQVLTNVEARKMDALVAERMSTLKRQEVLEELAGLQKNLEDLKREIKPLEETGELQSFGFYKSRYAFSELEKYKARLEETRGEQKNMIQQGTAATCAIEWTVGGSRTDGLKQTNQTIKLMLRAFNGECDSYIGKVSYSNIKVMDARIRKAWETINSLAKTHGSTISQRYLQLKINELELAHEYEEKLQEDKVEQRRIREEMKEEERALLEIEKARQVAEKEEEKYTEALRRARLEAQNAVGAKQQQRLEAQVAALEKQLQEAQANKTRAVSQAQLTRAGHIYIISNEGSFGEGVYKIGMTRRLDPMDRVKELGDASVPFEFDVHAIIYTTDAPTLENQLHKAFHHLRVNRINERKEFFRVSLDEIESHLRKHHKADSELKRLAEAVEFRKTLALNSERMS